MKTIDIVFEYQAGDDDNDKLCFVEVEQEDGKSIQIGEWIRRDDGYQVLRIPDPRPEVEESEESDESKTES